MKRYIRSDYDEFNISDASYTELEDAVVELRATLRNCKDPRKRMNIVNQIQSIQKELDSRWAQDITSAENIDDDEFDPYNGRRYRVDCGTAIKYTDSPKLALRTWAKFSSDNPGDCAIMTKYKDDAILLCEAAKPQYLQMLWDTYNPGYKLDWILDIVNQQLANNCSGFLGDGQYGDQVSPFSYG